MVLNSIVEKIVVTGSITDADVLALRRQCYADGDISKDEASQLFKINDSCPEHTLAWTDFFIEALTDVVVNQMRPTGYVDEINAEWLVTHIDADGKVESCNELELLINVIEKAKSVPPSLNLYALTQVKRTVLSGEGVTRTGKSLKAGIVTEGDVEILRRILFAYGSGKNMGITTEEAELLFDINDATTKAKNHPTWNVLFAQAIANHLMLAQGHITQDRETVLRQEKWLDEKPARDAFLNTMVKGLREIYKGSGNAIPSVKTKQSEKMSSSKAHWLTARINKDGHISNAERAALTFIKQQTQDIDPVLKPLLALVA